MNSHDRRITNRRWPYSVVIEGDEVTIAKYGDWLNDNFGTCRFIRGNKYNPRWCWRPYYNTEDFASFAMYGSGAELFFRKEKDYSWFMLKWS